MMMTTVKVTWTLHIKVRHYWSDPKNTKHNFFRLNGRFFGRYTLNKTGHPEYLETDVMTNLELCTYLDRSFYAHSYCFLDFVDYVINMSYVALKTSLS